MSRWGELIPHDEDNPNCLCASCEDERQREAEADTVLVDTGTYFVRVPKKPREES